MRIRYFPDTDTALIEFSTLPVVETKETLTSRRGLALYSELKRFLASAG